MFEIELDKCSDEELIEISSETGTGLSLDEMKTVRDYFRKENRNPTDIELQALGQAWSEHCCYKSSKPVLKQFIFDIEAPQNIMIISEDAGVVEFDDEHAYVVALESHNHPSAVEPYGGAATGIGGILRDVVCMGAQPVALIDPLFFGPLGYPEGDLPEGVKHPNYLTKGVVSGIRDYGNRVGIPTTTGMIYFHNGYLTNCLVNVGCVGIADKNLIIQSRVKAPGDIFVLAGGRTGRDGIHGVTFASAELTKESEETSRGAVQLGDPITKEPLIHACLEANTKGLLQGMKDLGGGGLSCVVGEMALAAGFGAEVQLEKVMLKEEGLKPWEIWVSESQERMMLAVTSENLEDVLAIFKKWDVEAVVLAKVIEGKRLKVHWHGEKIFEMDLEFLTGGPTYNRPFCSAIEGPSVEGACDDIDSNKRGSNNENIDNFGEPPADLKPIILKLLSRPNIASKDWAIRQYDHEVRASTALNPLQGKLFCETHGDSSIIKPLKDSWRGLALTVDVNPSHVEASPYWGSCAALDEVCRNLVAVGARPHSMADCLNFGNPEKPDRMGEFYDSCKGLGDLARALGIPFVSGNVSFYNETAGMTIPPTPTLLGVGIIEDIRKATTVDFKQENSAIYIVGQTKSELDGSEYFNMMDWKGTSVPRVNFELLKNSMESMLKAGAEELIQACHDLSEGGLVVAVTEMILGGNIGADIYLGSIGSEMSRHDFKMFSESPTRWMVEVIEEDSAALENLLGEEVPFERIGTTTGDRLNIFETMSTKSNSDSEETSGNKPLVSITINDLRDAWQNGLWKHLG
jgi:phosphoribosylformylglycinamidine synthase